LARLATDLRGYQAGAGEALKVDLLWGSFKYRPEKAPYLGSFLAPAGPTANSPCQ